MVGRSGENGPTVADIYSGVGGLSLGAELAGFRSLIAVDVDPTLQSGFRRNFPRSKAIEADVSQIDGGVWRHLLGRQRPDGVIGGPPCQGFSLIGKRREDDPRNSQIVQFFRHVGLLEPKFFLMENVEGLLMGHGRSLLEAGLSTLPSRFRVMEPLVVDASSWGAATSRRRVIVVGYDPSQMDAPVAADLSGPSPAATVRDAISDLPSPVAAPDDDHCWLKYPARAATGLSPYARRMRAPPPDHLGSDEGRCKHAQGYVSGLSATKHSREIARRYASIEGGKSDPITKSYKLEWGGLCPTLRAGTGQDRGAFQAVRPLHPGKGRVITVREAARLQGFPDWFVFHPTKWHSFRMLGNSVPPPVSQGILSAIAGRLQVALAA